MEALTPSVSTCETRSKLVRADDRPVEWIVADALVDYDGAVAAMTDRVAAISNGVAAEAVWLLEHPPLYTAGTSARSQDLVEARFPVHPSGRGGQYTYHGPGQRVAYVMLDLRERGRDVRCFVSGLETWLISTLAAFNVHAERREGRVGVWVARPEKGPGREDKIAAIGVRVSRWISFHGVALNVAPDLGNYAGIVPCGISDQSVTSLEDLGQLVSMAELDMALRAAFVPIFGPTISAPAFAGAD